MKNNLYLFLALFLIVSSAPSVSYADESAYEIEFWRSVKNSDDPADLSEYLKAYPAGKFAGLARNKLRRLTKETPARTKPGAIEPARTTPQNEPEPFITTKPVPVKTPPIESAPVRPSPATREAPTKPESVTQAPVAPAVTGANLVFYIQDTCGYCAEWTDLGEEDDCDEWVTFGRIISIDGKPAISSAQPVVKSFFGGAVGLSELIMKAGSQTVTPGAHKISYLCKGSVKGFVDPRTAERSIKTSLGETKYVVIEPARKDVFSLQMKISVSDSAPN